MAAVPLGKLAYLALRQVSKPIANYFKKQAAEHPFFRTQFVKFAQAYYRLEMAVKIRFMGHNPTAINPINESKAINLGADALGEMIVYSVASGLLISEYWKAQEKDKAKAAKVQQDFGEIREQLASLVQSIDKLQTENAELRDLFARTHVETEKNTRLITVQMPKGPNGTSSPPSPSTSSSPSDRNGASNVGSASGGSADSGYLSWLRVSVGSVFPSSSHGKSGVDSVVKSDDATRTDGAPSVPVTATTAHPPR
eukprot:Opistho-2@85351